MTSILNFVLLVVTIHQACACYLPFSSINNNQLLLPALQSQAQLISNQLTTNTALTATQRQALQNQLNLINQQIAALGGVPQTNTGTGPASLLPALQAQAQQISTQLTNTALSATQRQALQDQLNLINQQIAALGGIPQLSPASPLNPLSALNLNALTGSVPGGLNPLPGLNTGTSGLNPLNILNQPAQTAGAGDSPYSYRGPIGTSGQTLQDRLRAALNTFGSSSGSSSSLRSLTGRNIFRRRN